MNLIAMLIRRLGSIPYALVALFARIVVAHAFFASGQTKVQGPKIGGELLGIDFSIIIPTKLRDQTFTLFAKDYKVPVLPTDFAAYLATCAEHTLPVLLAIGLGARFSALGLIGMTLVIQVFVYPDAWWTVHAYWLALLLLIVARGPGRISLDDLLRRWLRGNAPRPFRRFAGAFRRSFANASTAGVRCRRTGS